MTARPEEIRARLIELSAGTELLREVRYMHAEDFDACSTDELVRGTRWLRAASYSALEGSRKLDRIVRARTATTEDPHHLDPTERTCTSDPTTTAAPTTSASSPTATPPPPAPRSRSSRKKTAPE